MTEKPDLVHALERSYGPPSAWRAELKAAAAHLRVLRELISDAYEPVLACAVEAIYASAANPTRYDFLGHQEQHAFRRRFGDDIDRELDLAFVILRMLSNYLGPDHYQRVIRAAWEAIRLEECCAAT